MEKPEANLNIISIIQFHFGVRDTWTLAPLTSATLPPAVSIHPAHLDPEGAARTGPSSARTLRTSLSSYRALQRRLSRCNGQSTSRSSDGMYSKAQRSQRVGKPARDVTRGFGIQSASRRAPNTWAPTVKQSAGQPQDKAASMGAPTPTTSTSATETRTA